MRRFTAAVLAAGAAMLPAAAGAQGVGVLARLTKGSEIPEARVLFYHDGEAHVCVALGIREGPGELRPGFLVFQDRPQEGRPARLDFEFDKKQVHTEKGLRMWETCLAGDTALEEGDEVQITVRRPRRKTQSFVVEVPPEGMAGGIDLWNIGDGELKPVVRVTPLGGEEAPPGGGP